MDDDGISMMIFVALTNVKKWNVLLYFSKIYGLVKKKILKNYISADMNPTEKKVVYSESALKVTSKTPSTGIFSKLTVIIQCL